MNKTKCNITYKVNNALSSPISYLPLNDTCNNLKNKMTIDVDNLVHRNVLNPVHNIIRINMKFIFEYDNYSFDLLTTHNKSNILKAFK